MTTPKNSNLVKEEKVRPIIILKPLNQWGRIAVKLIRFSSWLFIKTGNEYKK